MKAKRIVSILAAAALAGVAAAAGAHAQSQAPVEIVLDDDPDAPARRVVNVVFSGYLAERTGAQVETAVIDLDNDGTGEIVARFVHTGSCRENMRRCRTVVLKHDLGDWRIVLDRPAETLVFHPHTLRVPGRLDVDSTDWRWGQRRYEPWAGGFTGGLSMRDVPAANAASFAAAFGPGAEKLAAGGHGVSFRYSGESLSDGEETVVVQMRGDVACGEHTGCPVRVLRRNGETWSTVLSSSTTGHLSASDVRRGGWRDLVLQTKLGYVVMGWDGSAYAVADRVEAVERRR